MLVLSSHSRAARSRAAESDILRRRASRSNPVLMSGDTRQLYTSVFMHYIVVHQGRDYPANHLLEASQFPNAAPRSPGHVPQNVSLNFTGWKFPSSSTSTNFQLFEK